MEVPHIHGDRCVAVDFNLEVTEFEAAFRVELLQAVDVEVLADVFPTDVFAARVHHGRLRSRLPDAVGECGVRVIQGLSVEIDELLHNGGVSFTDCHGRFLLLVGEAAA